MSLRILAPRVEGLDSSRARDIRLFLVAGERFDNRWVSTSARALGCVGRDRSAALLARDLVAGVGGRYSRDLGIDVDGGEREVERWFVAATLFGNRISASIAARTFVVLDDAGLTRIALARDVPWDRLVELLDRGGYTRYDFRTATRLQALADVVDRRYDGHVEVIGERFVAYTPLRDALDALPGWGPVTVQLFLRELRGVWPGAAPPLDERAGRAARHLGLLDAGTSATPLRHLARLARRGRLDLRDLESALVKLALAHHGGLNGCPGGDRCRTLTRCLVAKEPG